MEEPKREYIVPAQPGWFVVSTIIQGESDSVELWEDPIIAWRIVSERTIDKPLVTSIPITTDGLDDEGEDSAWLRPDGKVVQPYVSAWDSKEEFLQEMRARKASRTAPNAAV